MDVVQTIRTPRDKPAREIYENYIKSASWRITRNHALRRADYRCERCGRNWGVQVHHKTYERLGHEWAQDLEVVCESCHRGLHLEEMRSDDRGRLYLKLANDAFHETPMLSSISDLADVVKARCAKLRIRYDAHQVDKALGLLTAQPRVSFQAATPEVTERPQHPPLSRSEARRIWDELTEQGLPMEQEQARKNEETKRQDRERRQQLRDLDERRFVSRCRECKRALTASQLEASERFCSSACADIDTAFQKLWSAARERVSASLRRCAALEGER